jgi:amino acid permease
MIAIGGGIGTGIFVASGASIATAGPGGAMVAYLLVGIMVYFVMTSLGEMATFMPVTGSFEQYATRFVDPALGFALGWNYWYTWTVTLPAELAAGAIVMKYWFPNTPSIVWSALFLALLFLLNVLSVREYGEGEYWFAGIKVLTAYIAQGRDLNQLAYRAKWYPFGPIFAAMLCTFVIVGQDISAFTGGQIDWAGVIATYAGIPLFLALWFGYKWVKKTKVIPLAQIDFDRR